MASFEYSKEDNLDYNLKMVAEPSTPYLSAAEVNLLKYFGKIDNLKLKQAILEVIKLQSEVDK